MPSCHTFHHSRSHSPRSLTFVALSSCAVWLCALRPPSAATARRGGRWRRHRPLCADARHRPTRRLAAALPPPLEGHHGRRRQVGSFSRGGRLADGQRRRRRRRRRRRCAKGVHASGRGVPGRAHERNPVHAAVSQAVTAAAPARHV
eukprot:284321-Prymnesium_polylepis.1